MLMVCYNKQIQMENQSFDFPSSSELSIIDKPEPPSPSIEALSHDALRIKEMYTQSFEAEHAGELDKREQLRNEIYEHQARLLAHSAFIKCNIHAISSVEAETLADELWQSKQLVKKHR